MSRILIVDDDFRFRRTLRVALVARGHQIVEAANGVEALDLIHSNAPDLVLLDWRMPGMGGRETCRALRACLHVPVVVVSSDRSLTQNDIEGAGAVGFVAKPFSIDELAAHIDAVVRP